MLLLFHIIVALSSIIMATYALVRPSNSKLHLSYCLIAATLATGTYLVIRTQNNILSSCLTGLVYFGVVLALSISAHRRLANSTHTTAI